MQFSAHTRSKGFALLITITLLAFLVLLLVSLASLTRVETQVASNNQNLAQARQNALMAMNIALGQLQKYVGPDQRTTARSDLDLNLANTPTKSGRWTGAYGNGVPVGSGKTDKYYETPTEIQDNLATYYTANPADPYVMKGSQARLLNWLVSGNEGATFVSAADGQITTTGTGITFSPTDTVTNLTGKTALSADITVKNATSFARLLVGPNSVTDPSDYVAAPLVPISAQAPGLGAATTVGNFAWWVGDEGTKARLNLPLDTTAANKPLAFVSAQRAAVELIDAKNPNGSTTLNTGDMLDRTFSLSRYDPRSPSISKILQGSQFSLLSSTNSTFLRDALKYRYHDVTLTSNSLLADAYAGGLKKDLSAVLATGATIPPDTRFVFKPQANVGAEVNELGLPTWGQLRSFAQTTASTVINPDGSIGQLPPAPPTLVMQTPEAGFPTSTVPVSTTVSVGPVLTYLALGFRVLAPEGDAKDQRISLGVYPIVVLWNPYTTTLSPGKYEVGMIRDYHSVIQIQGHDNPAPIPYPWGQTRNPTPNPDKVKTLDLGTDLSGNNYFRFVINSTKGIPPGQSIVFTLQETGKNFVAADPNNMLSDESYNPLFCSYISTGLKIGTAPAKGAGATYRVGVNNDATRKGPGTSKFVAFTNNDNPPNSFQPFDWGGDGTQQAYLSSFPGPSGSAGKPSGISPYYASGGTYLSRQWYQSISWIYSTSYNFAPFGSNVGFPSDPDATKPYPPGNPSNPGVDDDKWRGLLQPEDVLSPGGTPAWRMHVKATFQEGEQRSLTHHNSRALVTTQTARTSNPQTYTGTNYVSTNWPPITVDLSLDPARAPSAESLRSAKIIDATLFDVRPATQPLLSLGQLQHANLGWLGAGATYSFGNSNGHPAFELDSSKVALSTIGLGGNNNTMFKAVYDQSWLLNRALWDKYFVSTVPNKGTGTAADSSVTVNTDVPNPLPNPRHTRYTAIDDPVKLHNADLAATQLLLAGGFNINSTSEQAWRAVLGATNQLAYDPAGGIGGALHSGPVYSRFSKPTTNDTTNIWTGYRKLTEAQIAELAKNIVAQVRKRGPFVSLGDFVNRRLYENGAFPQNDDSRIKGTLQAAIDMSGTAVINDSVAEPKFNAPLVTPGDYNSANGKNDILPSTKSAFRNGGAYTNSGTVITNSRAPYSSKNSFSPQFLTQADVLSVIGSGLTARSDTFVIRTYGEVVNPVDSTQITGRAWCEAIVQRIPDYVDTALTADTQLQDIPAPLTPAKIAAKTTNSAFGRKFKIISFRWLSQNDI